ncbi:hypothetical protein ACVWZA_003767 [Sphingomonas sp. UYAg733]
MAAPYQPSDITQPPSQAGTNERGPTFAEPLFTFLEGE